MHDHATTIRGIEQGRARFAYEKVLEANEKLGEHSKKYKAYIKKIPMYIKTNGLGATVAFIKSKSNSQSNEAKVYHCIYSQFGEWLKKEEKALVPADEDLALAVISMESPGYRAVTNEMLSLLNWLCRFADGMIEGDADDDE